MAHHPILQRSLRLSLYHVACLGLMAHALCATPVFDAPESRTLESEEGKAVVQWSQPEEAANTDAQFELQQADNSEFTDPKTLYEGPDFGTVVTGLPEGQYFYRVREVLGPDTHSKWSKTLIVKVKYPDRRTVTVLMLVGLCVFIGTVTAIVMGHRRTYSPGVTA